MTEMLFDVFVSNRDTRNVLLFYFWLFIFIVYVTCMLPKILIDFITRPQLWYTTTLMSQQAGVDRDRHCLCICLWLCSWVTGGQHCVWRWISKDYCKSCRLISIYVDETLPCVCSPLLQNNQNKTRQTLKSSHQQLSSHLALSSHMLNAFILLILPVMENSDVNSYAMGLVATQRPNTKFFHLGQFCEW